MKPLSLKQRILNYLSNNEGWHAKGKICDLARDKTGMIGENTGRRLRELENSGMVEVKYEKGHAHYRAKPKQTIVYRIADTKELVAQVKLFK